MNAVTVGRSVLADAVDRYEPNVCDSCPRGVPSSARPGNLRMAHPARAAAQECEPILCAPLSSPARRSTRDVEQRPTRELQMPPPLEGASPDPRRIRFGPIELDEADARLTVSGHPVPLPPKPFAVLCALAREPQTLLTKNALLDAVWGHRFVSESVLKSAITTRNSRATSRRYRGGAIASSLPRSARRRDAHLPSSETSPLGVIIPP
jgi:hypothetical protein